MVELYREREDKFDVDARFVVPDLAALLPPGGQVVSSSEQLSSTYFDTAEKQLLGARMTLRRRTGTTDEGWQLKVPVEAARQEIRLPVDSDTPPDELVQLLAGVLRGRPLQPVATVRNERSVHRLVDQNGEVLAEIDDDSVHSTAVGEAAIATSWREVEVELGTADEELLTRVGELLHEAGATASASGSKLSRALGTPGAEPAVDRPTAADLVTEYIDAQRQAILAGDVGLRRGDDTVIHKTRVAVRRLRSTLRTFAALLDSERASALDAELRWYAGVLGEIRDRQVLRTRLHGLVDKLPDSEVLGPVRTRIDAELTREQSEHWERLQTELGSERYLTLLEQVDQWVREPPLTAKADKPIGLLRKLSRRADRKVSRRLAQANVSADTEHLHSARKAGKRARYAAELAEPATGAKAAAKQARRYEKLQDLLGEHQDSLMGAQMLRRLGAKAGTTKGENGFTFGMLYEREVRRASKVQKKARRVARKYRR